MGLILDTSILIAGERRRETVAQLLQRVQSDLGDVETALSAISIVELSHGIAAQRRRATATGARPSAMRCAAT